MEDTRLLPRLSRFINYNATHEGMILVSAFRPNELVMGVGLIPRHSAHIASAGALLAGAKFPNVELNDLNWFPYAEAETFADALQALNAKLEAVSTRDTLPEWIRNVDLVYNAVVLLGPENFKDRLHDKYGERLSDQPWVRLQFR